VGGELGRVTCKKVIGGVFVRFVRRFNSIVDR
jgi:hypothetical protein